MFDLGFHMARYQSGNGVANCLLFSWIQVCSRFHSDLWYNEDQKNVTGLKSRCNAVYLYAGFSRFWYLLVWFSGAEQYVNSGMASVLFAVYPFCVAIVAHFRLSDEILNKTKLTGMIIGFGGIIGDFFRQSGNQI